MLNKLIGYLFMCPLIVVILGSLLEVASAVEWTSVNGNLYYFMVNFIAAFLVVLMFAAGYEIVINDGKK